MIMLVKYWMRKVVVTMDVEDSMQEAISTIKDYELTLLPVLKNGKLVGVVTDRDLKRASASDATTLDVHELAYLIAKIKLGSIMSKNPVTVAVDETLEEAADTLLKAHISSAPVLDYEGRIVGTIGQREIFSALVSMCGLEKKGVQFACRVEDRPGSIKEVTDVIRNHGGRLVSILTSYERAPSGYRHVYVRAFQIDRADMVQLEAELRAKAVLMYVVDHRENRRVEYLETHRAS
jgi:acetoin utilization protein AcuB